MRKSESKRIPRRFALRHLLEMTTTGLCSHVQAVCLRGLRLRMTFSKFYQREQRVIYGYRNI